MGALGLIIVVGIIFVIMAKLGEGQRINQIALLKQIEEDISKQRSALEETGLKMREMVTQAKDKGERVPTEYHKLKGKAKFLKSHIGKLETMTKTAVEVFRFVGAKMWFNPVRIDKKAKALLSARGTRRWEITPFKR